MDSVQGNRFAFSTEEVKKVLRILFGAVVIALAVFLMPSSAYADEAEANEQASQENVAAAVDDSQQSAVDDSAAADASATLADQSSDAPQSSEAEETAQDDQAAETANADAVNQAAGATELEASDSESNANTSKQITTSADNELSADDIEDITSMTYDGTQKQPILVVSKNGVVLTEGTDYTVEYSDNVNAGENTAIAIIHGMGSYTGTASKPFSILKADLSNVSVTVAWEDAIYTFDGNYYSAPVTTSGTTVDGSEITFKYYLSGQDPSTATSEVTGVRNVGNHYICYIASAENHNDATGSFCIHVLPGFLTVTANSLSKTYGDADPELTVSYEGLVEGEALPQFYLYRATGENVGTYKIIIDGEKTQGCYQITWKSGTFTINKKAVSVTADNKTVQWGDSEQELTATVTGLVGTDTVAYTLAREAGTDIGEYYITAVGESDQGNYTVSLTNGVYTITKREVSVTADDIYKTYGDADPTLTATVEGLLGSDTIEYTLSRDAGEETGPYLIHATGVEEQGNYHVTFNAGNLFITLKPVTVKAVAASKTYGDADPTFTATVEGLLGSDTVSYTITRETGEDAGEYDITFRGTKTQGNYTVTYVPGTFTITQKAVTVTANDSSKIYGDADPEFTATVTGLLGSDTVDYSFTREAGENADEYDIMPSGQASQGNYQVSFEKGTFTINRRNALVKADDKTKAYGDADPEFTVTVTGTVNGDSLAYQEIWRTAGEDVGTYCIQLTGSGLQGNYLVAFDFGYLTIAQKEITVTADEKSKAYGDADPELTATVTGLLGSDTVTYQLTREAGEAVRPYTITVTGDASQGNYHVTFVSGLFTITHRRVTVVPDNKVKTYGSADPEWTASVLNLIGSDTVSYSLSRQSGENVGEYDITSSGDAIQGNYLVNYNTGTLFIQQKAVTVTAEDKTKVYGDSDPTFTAVVEGVLDGDTINYSMVRAIGEFVGEYAINLFGSESQGNYSVSFTPGKMTITYREAKVVADNKYKTYGDDDPELTATVFNLVGSDTVAYELTREAGENVGTYTITPSGSDIQRNYKVEFVNGAFGVLQRIATITADNKSKTYGDADPELTATITNLVGSDSLTYTLERDAGEDVGTYTIHVSGSEFQGNYATQFMPGTFTITGKPVTVTADNGLFKTYGDADPTFTATVSDASLADVIQYSVSREEGENVGDYSVTPTGNEIQGNYKVSFAPATFTIIHKNITVTANDMSKTYGDADPELTATISGLVGSDTVGYTLTRTQGEEHGSYTITATAAIDQGNYLVDTADATFTINRKPITVVADVKAKFYGDADPELTATVQGLVGTDTVTYDLVREDFEDVGMYTIEASGEYVQGSYLVSYSNGIFVINRRIVNVIADDKTKTYGEMDPDLTATLEGLLDGDTVSYVVYREDGEHAGTYSIIPSGAEMQGNYQLNLVSGTLTIAPKPMSALDITNENGTEFTFNGSEQSPNFIVTNGDMLLKEGVDYKLTDGAATKIGAYTASFTGLGNYGGTEGVSWWILTPTNTSFQGEGTDISDTNRKVLDDSYRSMIDAVSQTGSVPETVKETTEGAISNTLASGDDFITEARAEQVSESAVPANDKDLIAIAVQNLVAQGGSAEVLAYLDAEVLLKNALTGEVLAHFTQTDGPIAFAVQLDADILSKLAGKCFQFFRVHDGECAVLDCTIDGDILKFSSDLFSTFALAEVTEPEPEPEPEPGPAPEPSPSDKGAASAQAASYSEGSAIPQTGDSLPVAPVAGIALAAAAAMAAASRKRARE